MSIRQLQPNEPIPKGEPRRYKNAAGYIRLRWSTKDGNYIEAYEHRVVTGAGPRMQVHHRNHDKSDNRLENLEILTSTAHGKTHRRINDSEIATMYASGLSIPAIHQRTGWDMGALSRSLKRSQTVVVQGERNRTRFDEATALAWYHNGMRVNRIAQWLGVGRGAVERMLKREGLPPFPVGAPKK
ncbi:hypothetical protein LCGC14_0378620 [marine sediment metagenome]|uniref:HNH nuclease domain-containing protein n=1 Tax=marine sediment metagenome TaxID=412755 RepID=A0A0F9T8R8_9ZZZZ